MKTGIAGKLPASMKSASLTSKLLVAGAAVVALAVPAMAAATDVTTAISGVAGDASDGVTAGVTIGAVVFGAKVVWGAIKSMAH